MLRVLVLTSLVTVSVCQLTSSCTTCTSNSNYGSTSQTSSYNTNSVQRDSTASSSSNQPGYLPDYQGDRYTDPQRIAETQALNKAFFDSIGGAPSPPPETPAQQGMNGSSGSSASGSTSTTYTPSSSYGYSTQYYNPSAPSSSRSSTSYSNPSTAFANSQQQQQQSNQNFVAYDATNQNSPLYYQRVPSTAQYNSVLGVNAGFPQYVNQNQALRDQNNQGYGGNQVVYSTPSTQSYGTQGAYQNQNTQTTAFMYASSTQYNNNNNNNQQAVGSSTAGYTNGQNIVYDQNYGSQQQTQYGSSSTVSPQYSADAISCCSQVSSTCCYQTQQGYQSQSNIVQYSPSVYQYGRK